jgi:hypothetical protein
MVVYYQMALFLVVALQKTEVVVDMAVSARVNPSDYFQIESGKWIIDASVSTSKEVSDLLTLTESTTHFVMPVRGYFGRAQPALWEWLAAKTSKVNA